MVWGGTSGTVMIEHQSGLALEISAADWRHLLELAGRGGWNPAGAHRLRKLERDPYTRRLAPALLGAPPGCDIACYSQPGIQIDAPDVAAIIAAIPPAAAGTSRPRIDGTLGELRIAVDAGEPVFVT